MVLGSSSKPCSPKVPSIPSRRGAPLGSSIQARSPVENAAASASRPGASASPLVGFQKHKAELPDAKHGGLGTVYAVDSHVCPDVKAWSRGKKAGVSLFEGRQWIQAVQEGVLRAQQLRELVVNIPDEFGHSQGGSRADPEELRERRRLASAREAETKHWQVAHRSKCSGPTRPQSALSCRRRPAGRVPDEDEEAAEERQRAFLTPIATAAAARALEQRGSSNTGSTSTDSHSSLDSIRIVSVPQAPS
ncbi:unnamed protein product, partial [Polarella glacialis]